MAILASTFIHTDFGRFRVCYHKSKAGICISFSKGDLSKNIPIIRFHSACLFGEAFHSLHCDCDSQIINTMRLIKRYGRGMIVYTYQEGRGIGLEKKIKAMEIQRVENCDTVEAFKKLGFNRPDYRHYKESIDALKDLKVSKTIMTFSGSPRKIKIMEDAGYIIKKIIKSYKYKKHLSKLAKEEIKVKEQKMGYIY